MLIPSLVVSLDLFSHFFPLWNCQYILYSTILPKTSGSVQVLLWHYHSPCEIMLRYCLSGTWSQIFRVLIWCSWYYTTLAFHIFFLLTTRQLWYLIFLPLNPALFHWFCKYFITMLENLGHDYRRLNINYSEHFPFVFFSHLSCTTCLTGSCSFCRHSLYNRWLLSILWISVCQAVTDSCWPEVSLNLDSFTSLRWTVTMAIPVIFGTKKQKQQPADKYICERVIYIYILQNQL